MVRRRSSIFDRLVRSRLELIAVVLVVVGLVLMVFGHNIDGGGWVRDVPVLEIGQAFVELGGLAVIFEYLVRRINEQRAAELWRRIFREEASMLGGRVLSAPEMSARELARFTDEELDRLGEAVCEARARGRPGGGRSYRRIRDQELTAVEQWRHVSVMVALLPSPDGPVSGPGSMFTATVVWKYTTVPGVPVLRFVCVSDDGEYHALAHDQQVTMPWLFGSVEAWDAGAREVFEVLSVTVDDRTCPIQRAARVGSQTYEACVPAEIVAAGREVEVEFTYRVLVARLGWYLFVTTPRPTEGFEVTLNYSAAGIRRLTPVPYLPGVKAPSIVKAPATTPDQSVNVSIGDSIPPGCGAQFHWILADE